MNNNMKYLIQKQMLRYLIILVILIFSILFTINIVSAETFNVATTVTLPCTPLWYCTDYTEDTCGTRTCLDSNSCGINTDKPPEYLACVPKKSGGGSASDVDTSVTPNVSDSISYPNGYFTLDKDLIKLTVEQDALVQKIISVKSIEPASYRMNIIYPLGYTGAQDFITSSSLNKYILDKETFNLIIDAKNIPIGTYVTYVSISNQYNSRNITLVVDIVVKSMPLMIVDVDSSLKIQGVDEYITTYVGLRGINLSSGDKMTLSIFDPKGNLISAEKIPINDPTNVIHKLLIPQTASEGYYTLAVLINSNEKNYTKSATFTLLPQDKYSPILEMPARNSDNTIILILILIIALILLLALIVLLNKNAFYGLDNKKGVKSKGLTMFKFSFGKPVVKINLNVGGKASKNSGVSDNNGKNSFDVNSEGKVNSKNLAHKLDLLKKSYDRGFMSLSEYRSALKNRGYIVESETITEPYIKPSSETKKSSPIESTPNVVRSKISSLANLESNSDTKKVPLSINLSPNKVPFDIRVPNDKAFILNDSKKLFSLRDLANALPDMSNQVFAHHTLQGRNDFADWIKYVFSQYDLAAKIRLAKTKEELLNVLKNNCY